MSLVPPAILQTASDPPLGFVIVLATVVGFVLLLTVLGVADWLSGPDRETATYRLVETGDGLALAKAAEAAGGRLIGLDEAQMTDFLDRVEGRNEMRLHAVVDAEGKEEPWEDWRAEADRKVPSGVVIEDSKGMVEIDRQGRVTAQPPMDEAVRDDLLEVLATAVDTPRSS